MAALENEVFAVRRVGGNYQLDDELDRRVREAIYGDHWRDMFAGSVGSFYDRTMTAMWAKLPTIAAAGIPVDDAQGWTRPHLHVLLDVILAVMRTPARDALRFIDAVYGADADEMFRLFAASPVCVACHEVTMAELAHGAIRDVFPPPSVVGAGRGPTTACACGYHPFPGGAADPAVLSNLLHESRYR